MYNSAYRIVGNPQDAEDVIQEAFTKAFSRLDQFEHKSGFGPWLKRIVINQAINALKKNQTLTLNENMVMSHDDDSYEETYDYDINQVIEALETLPTGYRTVISLYLLEGYDHQEISEILGISVSTSISQLSRGKKKLKQSLKQTGSYGQARSII